VRVGQTGVSRPDSINTYRSLWPPHWSSASPPPSHATSPPSWRVSVVMVREVGIGVGPIAHHGHFPVMVGLPVVTFTHREGGTAGEQAVSTPHATSTQHHSQASSTVLKPHQPHNLPPSLNHWDMLYSQNVTETSCSLCLVLCHIRTSSTKLAKC
jgi:hypothetical protein